VKEYFFKDKDYIKYLEDFLDSEIPCWREHNEFKIAELEKKQSKCHHSFKKLGEIFGIDYTETIIGRIECSKCGLVKNAGKVKHRK